MTVAALGCDVTYDVTNRMTNNMTYRARQGLEFAASPEGIHVHNGGTTPGVVGFEVTAREGCGGRVAGRKLHGDSDARLRQH